MGKRSAKKAARKQAKKSRGGLTSSQKVQLAAGVVPFARVPRLIAKARAFAPKAKAFFGSPLGKKILIGAGVAAAAGGAALLARRGRDGAVGLRRRRRISGTNVRALSRAAARLAAFDKVRKRVEKAVRKAIPSSMKKRAATPGTITRAEAEAALRR